jgi:hypothetical protein
LVTGPTAWLNLEDSVINDTRGRDLVPRGRGIVVRDSAELVANRLRLERNRTFGILAYDRGVVDASDIWIEETALARCFEVGGCDSNASAIGLSDGTLFTLRRSVLQESERCGLFVYSDRVAPGTGLVEVRDTLIARNQTGVCVEVDDFPEEQVAGRTVVYEDNQSNIRTTDLGSPNTSGE